MISCIALERPGKWRAIGIAVLFMAISLPTLPLLWGTSVSVAVLTDSVTGSFVGALKNSLFVGFNVAVISLAVGLPLGVLTALYEYPGRKVLIALAALPLLVPSFLWAIGWSSLAMRLGPVAMEVVSGFSGCILVFAVGAIPLVLLTAYAATRTLSRSQVDAARLAGGEVTILAHATRHAVTPAILAAGLGSVLAMVAPGPGQIFGVRTAASEILTSFSAFYDFASAGMQCAALTGVVLLFAVPLALFSAPRIASEILVRQTQKLQRSAHGSVPILVTIALAGFLLIGVATPILGLLLPLTHDREFARAISEITRTAINTIIYAAGAGIISALLALLTAFFVGRDFRLRKVVIVLSFVLFSLPPAFMALGIVRVASLAPAWADPLLRSRLTVCLALALRYLPVAIILGLRAWGSTSTSWTMAAGLHGVTLIKYLRRILLPQLLPSSAVAFLLVALLAMGDISTVLLLHPPGEASFPLAIFTVMANAPEALVASLCLVHLVATGGFLVVLWRLAGGRNEQAAF